MSVDAAVRVIITGGSGFIGTNLVEHYRGLGAEVRSVDICRCQNREHDDHWSQVDVLDGDALGEIFDALRPNLVIHAAARTDLRGKRIDEYPENTEGVVRVVEAIRASPSVRRVVFFSSRMVCPIGYQPRDERDYDPPNAYGASKMVGEQIVRAADIGPVWTVVRPTSVWGPWFGVPYRTFFDSVARGRFFHCADSADVAKSFGFVGNTVYQVARIAEAPAELVRGKTLYLADYPPLTLGRWAELVRRECGVPRIRTLPYRLLRGAALVGDVAARFGAEPPLTSFRLANLLTPMIYETDLLQRVVGDLPYTLEAGVAETVDWMRRDQ